MFDFALGFAVGVVAGPAFVTKVWPKLKVAVVTWWKSHFNGSTGS